jgi:type I restriction enzyme S subunit
MSFPRYPEYKDSGVEWLGEVPGSWEVISIKWLSSVKRGASPRPIDDPKYFDDEGEYAWVRIADVSACDGVLNETTQRLSELGSSLSVKIDPGELFVSIAGTVGKPCMSAIKACIHDGFVYFPDLEIDPNFLYRIFEGRTCYGGLGKWGTQLNLNTDTIGSIRIALPPPRELNHVLAFLDRETAKIDALVAEQRRLIELLKEKRQAVISHAVTKGLNPDAPMKDSGIEWLGEVPAHWEVMRLKHVSPQITVGIVVEPSKYYVEDGVPALRSLNVEQGSVKLENLVFISKEANEAQAKSKLRQGDLVAVRTGQPGTTAVIPPDLDGCNCIDLIIIRKPANGNEWFLSWFLASDFALIQFSSGSGGAIQQHFNVGTAVNLIIPIPPRDEQNAIVDFINAETTKFDTLTSEAQRAIDLLQERRTALISAAVTGQIDVRHLSA